MKFVPIKYIEKDSTLSKSIYGVHGELLLNSGVELNEAYIEKLHSLGINGVYIYDQVTDDIEVDNVINDNLKNQAVQTIKNVFNFVAKPETSDIEKKRSFERISKVVDNIIENLYHNKNHVINMIDIKLLDDYLFYHSVNVTVLSLVVGIELRLTNRELHDLGLAAILHDIGSVFVSQETLNKQGKLNDKERQNVQAHSIKGYSYIKNKFGVSNKTYQGVLQHHERWSGTGYPHGLKGDKISLFGRIIAIADAYDALISDRPHRQGFSPFEAMEYIMGGGGSMFDIDLIKIFVKKIAPFPVGTMVKLSNNATGIVMRNFPGRGLRPILQIIKENDIKVEPYILDLWDTDTKTITITEQVFHWKTER